MRLKLKYPLASIVQVILYTLLSRIAIFTFSQSSFYGYFLTIIPGSVAMRIIPLMLLILVPLGIYASIRGSNLFTASLILFCVPAILEFSFFIRLLDLPIEASLKLSEMEMLTIAGVITTGHFSFLYLNHFKKGKSGLLGRGGSEDEINRCYLKSNAFGFLLILLALLSATALLIGTRLLQGIMSELTTIIPMRMFVIGIGASLMVIAAVYVLIIKWSA